LRTLFWGLGGGGREEERVEVDVEKKEDDEKEKEKDEEVESNRRAESMMKGGKVVRVSVRARILLMVFREEVDVLVVLSTLGVHACMHVFCLSSPFRGDVYQR
jgi:hypothetical protein